MKSPRTQTLDAGELTVKITYNPKRCATMSQQREHIAEFMHLYTVITEWNKCYFHTIYLYNFIQYVYSANKGKEKLESLGKIWNYKKFRF